jgi:hypothetical protein
MPALSIELEDAVRECPEPQRAASILNDAYDARQRTARALLRVKRVTNEPVVDSIIDSESVTGRVHDPKDTARVLIERELAWLTQRDSYPDASSFGVELFESLAVRYPECARSVQTRGFHFVA